RRVCKRTQALTRGSDQFCAACGACDLLTTVTACSALLDLLKSFLRKFNNFSVGHRVPVPLWLKTTDFSSVTASPIPSQRSFFQGNPPYPPGRRRSPQA